MGFSFIFRGALDVHATRINEDMQIAAVHALRDLTHAPVPRDVLDAYKLDSLAFGPDYILPLYVGSYLRIGDNNYTGVFDDFFRRFAMVHRAYSLAGIDALKTFRTHPALETPLRFKNDLRFS